MIHLLHPALELSGLGVGQTFRHKHGVGALAKVIEQDLLALHRLDVVGQVVEDVIIDTGVKVSDGRRDEQQNAQHQNRHPESDDLFAKL